MQRTDVAFFFPHSCIVIDIAGQYAGFLQSVVVGVKNSCWFVNSVLIGLLIQNHVSFSSCNHSVWMSSKSNRKGSCIIENSVSFQTQTEWNFYFALIGCFTMYGVIVFVLFGSGELQPWAKEQTTSDDRAVCDNTSSHIWHRMAYYN